MATNPSLQYTDDQLRQALIDAAALENIDLDLEMGATYIAGFEIRDLRRILDHLPDQQHDYNYNAMLQMHKLQGITGDINETIEWLIALNYVVAFGVEREELLKPANPEPREDQQDDWIPCSFDEIRKGDRVKKVTTKEGTTETLGGTASQRLGKYTKSWANDQDRLIFDNHEFCDQLVRYYRIPAPVVAPNPAEHPVITIKAINGEPIDAPGNAMFWGGHYRYGYDDMTIAEDITDWEPAKVVPKNFEGNYPKRKLEYKGFPND